MTEPYFSIIKIHTATGTHERAGLIIGAIAIINDPDKLDGFNLTHLATGQRILGCETLEDALRGATELQEDTDIDWSFEAAIGTDIRSVLPKKVVARMAAMVNDFRLQLGYY